MNPLFVLIATIILAGVGLFYAEQYLPMPDPVKMLLRIVVVIVLVVMVLRYFFPGLIG